MNNNQRLFLDIHAIQVVPPSNINRDDTGSPKTALYGGVRRARVSSQSWKHAMRRYFNENGSKENVGVRTLDIVEYVAQSILSLNNHLTKEEALNMADDVLNKAGIKTELPKKTDKETAVKRAKALTFLGSKQAQALAKSALDGVNDKKVLQDILTDNPAIDIALFGRMVADDASLNEDASCQVAHAISTHAVQTEFDYFTAIDDLSPEEKAEAKMLGTIEYNSSTLYRYANIALHEFVKQLDDQSATIEAVKLFIKAFVLSMPTGKMNTFANATLPQLVLVSLRHDRPVNLVTAFEQPVRTDGHNGYAKSSCQKLFDEGQKIDKFTEKADFTAFVAMEEMDQVNTFGQEEVNLQSLLDELGLQLNERLAHD